MKRYDVLFGDVVPLPAREGEAAVLVRRLDFVVSMAEPARAADLVSQWESSDRHYDYVVCEGAPGELIVFQREEDLEKFEFYTFLCPVTASYRLAREGEY